MISKPLFKQSCKANGTMWAIITFAVCFMLVCVMTIGGSGALDSTKTAIQNTIIKGELQSQTESRALNYYELSESGLEYFDEQFKTELASVQQTDQFKQVYTNQGEDAAKQYASSVAYKNAVTGLQKYAVQVATEKGYQPNSDEATEILGVMMYTLNPMTKTTQTDGKYMFDDFYASVGETAPRYDVSGIQTMTADERAAYISDYAFENSTIFLSGNMTKPENAQKIVDALAKWNVTEEDYKNFGYENYATVKDIATSVLVNYRATLSYRIENKKDGETIDGIKAELNQSFTQSLLSSLPEEVSSALEDLGSMDLFGILVGSIFFKIAGLLLPIIFLIMASNNLMAGQVDSGSMAYVLSTPTKRKQVVATQSLFLIFSLFAMFVLTCITSIICINVVDVNTSLNVGKLILINLGAFLVMFAMSGISFLASSWSNRSKYSMAIGGGLNIFFLVATILGLFGSPVIPSVVRMNSLGFFNYLSIISLFDVVSIIDGTTAFIWKFAILLAVGIACYAISFVKFDKKDLPL